MRFRGGGSILRILRDRLGLLGSRVASPSPSLASPTGRKRPLKRSRPPTPNPYPPPWYASRGRGGMLVLALIFLIAVYLVLRSLGALRPGRVAPSGEFV